MSLERGVLVGLASCLLLGAPVGADADSRTSQSVEPATPSLASPAPSPQAKAALQLLASRDLYQQQLGFLRLEALREPATVAPITPYLTRREPELRAYSLRAVGAIEGLSSVPLLLQVLKRDASPMVRRAALLGLEPFVAHDPRIVPALLTALRDSKTDVRMTAVDIVSRIDTPQAKAAIRQRYKRERRRDVRRVLELAMKRIAP